MITEHPAKTLMIIGVGVLGGQLLDLITVKFPNHHYIVVARNKEYLVNRVNLTKTVLSQWRLYPSIHIETCDVKDTGAFSELIRLHNPDLIFNATTPFPWWKISRLPPQLAELANLTGPGIWCALDAILPLHIAEGIKRSGISTIFVNGCYPDVINVFLARHPNAPLIGIGNIANVIPGMRIVLAENVGVHPDEIDLRLICHHFTSLNAPVRGKRNGAPFALWVKHGNVERTYFDDDYPFLLLREKLPRLRGLAGQAVTASSAAALLSALQSGARQLLHAPGPNGLPGGYPILIDSNGSIKIDLPAGVSLSEGIRINERGQFLDGVEHVSHGLIRPTDAARDAFKKIVGLHLPNITFDNVHEVANATLVTLNKKYELE